MKIDIKFDGKPGYGVYINELKELKFGAKVAIVTNAKVGGLYLQNLLSRIDCPHKFIISVPDGEEYKNMQTIEAILEQLFVSRLDRSSVIIALGGGVVGDARNRRFAALCFGERRHHVAEQGFFAELFGAIDEAAVADQRAREHATAGFFRLWP